MMPEIMTGPGPVHYHASFNRGTNRSALTAESVPCQFIYRICAIACAPNELMEKFSADPQRYRLGWPLAHNTSGMAEQVIRLVMDLSGDFKWNIVPKTIQNEHNYNTTYYTFSLSTDVAAVEFKLRFDREDIADFSV